MKVPYRSCPLRRVLDPTILYTTLIGYIWNSTLLAGLNTPYINPVMSDPGLVGILSQHLRRHHVGLTPAQLDKQWTKFFAPFIKRINHKFNKIKLKLTSYNHQPRPTTTSHVLQPLATSYTTSHVRPIFSNWHPVMSTSPSYKSLYALHISITLEIKALIHFYQCITHGHLYKWSTHIS